MELGVSDEAAIKGQTLSNFGRARQITDTSDNELYILFYST